MRQGLCFLILVLTGAGLCGAHDTAIDLLGPTTRDDILRVRPEWRSVVDAYNPRGDIVERLRSLGTEVKVEIYLGTWCSDSEAHVSAFFKVLDLAENPLLQASYIGVPEDKSLRAPYCGDRGIEKLPTFIVSVGGREKGRIVETPQKSVEEDLLALIEK